MTAAPGQRTQPMDEGRGVSRVSTTHGNVRTDRCTVDPRGKQRCERTPPPLKEAAAACGRGKKRHRGLPGGAENTAGVPATKCRPDIARKAPTRGDPTERACECSTLSTSFYPMRCDRRTATPPPHAHAHGSGASLEGLHRALRFSGWREAWPGRATRAGGRRPPSTARTEKGARPHRQRPRERRRPSSTSAATAPTLRQLGGDAAWLGSHKI